MSTLFDLDYISLYVGANCLVAKRKTVTGDDEVNCYITNFVYLLFTTSLACYMYMQCSFNILV